MRHLIIVLFSLIATPALAHVGHIGEMAGHNHVGAAIALGAAAGIAIWGAIKGKKEDDASSEAEAESEPDAEPQEA